ncbi:MAG TPA: hypothetical protein PKN70_15690, partial [Smithellaceae bacterium]|nr:hypothetical protein [Smithellaceae bacterium]
YPSLSLIVRSGSSGCTPVLVQVQSSAPFFYPLFFVNLNLLPYPEKNTPLFYESFVVVGMRRATEKH